MNKDSRVSVSAIIVAAGRGTRMNMEINKQFIDISGKEVLARTMDAFNSCKYIDEIILVVNADDIIYCKDNLVERYKMFKVKSVVAGGEERQNSVYNGLLAVDKDCEVVLIHDGARPFVSEKCIVDSIKDASEFGASCVAVPVKDTIKLVDSNGFVKDTLDRNRLWSIQTPQTFKYDEILKAHNKAQEDGFLGTDDAVLMERIGIKMRITMGSYDNIKITTKEDLILGEAIVSKY